MRFRSTAKVLAECKLKNYKISKCDFYCCPHLEGGEHAALVSGTFNLLESNRSNLDPACGVLAALTYQISNERLKHTQRSCRPFDSP